METTTKSKSGRAFNAYRHGLTGQVLVRTPSEQAAYEEFCRGIHHSLAPMGALEKSIVQSIADDRWRLHRAAAMESDIFVLVMSDPDDTRTGIPDCDEALAQARAWLARGKSLELLGLYEHRLTRHVEKNMAELRRLQAERQAAREKAFEEAALLRDLFQSRDEPFIPARDIAQSLPPQFVFSDEEPSRGFGRFLDLREAKTLAKNRPSTPQDAPKMAA